MRRWLPIVLLLALAGLAALVLRGSSKRIEPVAAEREAALTPARSTSDAAMDAVPAEPNPARAALDSQVKPPTPSAPDPLAAHLTVHIVAQRGHAPVADVRIALTSPDVQGLVGDLRSSSGANGDLATSPITGAEGIVRFDLPPAREFRIHARREDSTKNGSPIEVVGVDGGSARYTVNFDRPLHIRLSGGDGEAATSALVPALREGEQRELELVIEDELEGHVFGKVICAETREPVAGARVQVLAGGQTRVEWRAPGADTAITGNDGAFELPFSLTSDPRLWIEAPGYGLRYANLDAVHADEAHALVVYVSRAATLSVRVLDAAGAPIQDAWIELSTKGYLLAHHEADEQGFFSSGITFSFPPDEHWRGQTGADGRARIEGLPARVDITAAAVKEGKQLRRERTGLSLQPGEQRELEWRIGAGTLVRGRALDQEGKPVAGLEIWAARSPVRASRYFMYHERERVDRKATSDGEGRFTLADLVQGRWEIGPAVENTSLCAPITLPLEIAGEPALDLVLHVSRGLFIRGRVLAPSGEGAPNVWVNGFTSPTERLDGARSESDGSFALGPLGPGALTLTADAIGRFASSDPVQASAGDRNVVLQLKQGGAIHGHVVDGATGVACSAQIILVPEQVLAGLFTGGLQTSTSPDGSFGMTGLPSGSWSVTASTADGKFAQQAHIEVGPNSDSGELVLALSPGGRLRLSYKGAEPWVFVTVTCQGAAVLMQTGVEPGKFVEEMAPAGALVIEIRKTSTGPARTQAVELKAGETREVILADEP